MPDTEKKEHVARNMALRMGTMGGGGALVGLLTGWLLDHKGKQLAKDAAFFGAAGAGLGEGIYRYAKHMNTAPVSKLDRGKYVAMNTISTRPLKTLAKQALPYNPFNHKTKALGDALAVANLAERTLHRNQTNESNVHAATAFSRRMVGKGLETAAKLVDNANIITPSGNKVTWMKLLQGTGNAEEKAAFKKWADNNPSIGAPIKALQKYRVDLIQKGNDDSTLFNNKIVDAAGQVTQQDVWSQRRQLMQDLAGVDGEKKNDVYKRYQIDEEMKNVKQTPAGKKNIVPVQNVVDALRARPGKGQRFNSNRVLTGDVFVPLPSNYTQIGFFDRLKADVRGLFKAKRLPAGGDYEANSSSPLSIGLSPTDKRYGAKTLGMFRNHPVAGSLALSAGGRIADNLLTNWEASKDPRNTYRAD